MIAVNENPWVLEQMMRSRMEDVRRHSTADQMTRHAYPSAGWHRQFGELLIRAGRRLAGPEPTPYGPRRSASASAGC
jgi:hypothetical protein